MPSEKYSPLLLCFNVYLRPVSRRSHSTLPWVIGCPLESRHTPFTEPVACAKTGGTHSPSSSATSATHAKRCFIVSLPADFWKFIAQQIAGFALSQICNLNAGFISARRLYGGNRLCVRDRISRSGLFKCAQPQDTAVTDAASAI